MRKHWRFLTIIATLLAIGLFIVVAETQVTQITQSVGLGLLGGSSPASSPTYRWKDVSAGLSTTTGIAAVGLYTYSPVDLTWKATLRSIYEDDLTTSYGLNTASFLYGFDAIGANWDRVHIDSSGYLYVTAVPPTQVLTTLLNAVVVPTIGATTDTIFLLSKHTWEIVVTGAPANESTNLEGSINGTTWYILDTSIITTSEMRHVVNKPVRYVRGNCTVLPGGTVTVRYIGGGN